MICLLSSFRCITTVCESQLLWQVQDREGNSSWWRLFEVSAAGCESLGCYPWWEEIKGNVLAAVQDYITVVTDGLAQNKKVMKYLIS